MVGSGFSRSAASTGDVIKKLPLWNDLSKVLTEELGTHTTDPLRLAEEYSAYFGKQALHELIKKEVNDAAWKPSELHESLLRLPWTDVLSTNWDTLLERASKNVHQPVYSVVSKQDDLSNARPPRIIKLHGTLDITKELIFTQEDYRKYPQNHAAFVNCARQVFIENELCLLGFSGDDPNFINWAGWVRDHLASHSRRIYLVGALSLSAAQRKYLESINIAPIDLSELVKDYDEADARHVAATKLFIRYLQDAEPKQAWKWQPVLLDFVYEENADDKSLSEKLKSLEENRLSYPGWLICPSQERFFMHSRITGSLLSAKGLASISQANKAKLLYELVWTHTITFETIDTWLIDELLAICNPEKPCPLRKKQQLEIAVFLLKQTRWMEKSQADKVFKITSEILEKDDRYYSKSGSELAYHKAIIARDSFNYTDLEKHITGITATDPVWQLRKASLFNEIGEFEKAKALVEEAHKELLIQYRNHRNSIHILSRLAWADELMRSSDRAHTLNYFENIREHYQKVKSRPRDHFEYLNKRLVAELERQQGKQGVEPLFEPGHYKDNADKVSFSNEIHPLLLLEELTIVVGVPLHWTTVNLLASAASKVAQLEDVEKVYCFVLAIRSAESDSSDILKKVFSRINIACLSESEINILYEQCIQAIGYWRTKLSSAKKLAIERLQVFIEVLARLSVRVSKDNAKQIFRLALSLNQDANAQHPLLFSVVRRLSEYSLESIPVMQQHEVLTDALSFLLPNEIVANIWVEKLANPIIKKPGERKYDVSLNTRIDEIIESIKPQSKQLVPALERLIPLIKNNFLTANELRKIQIKIWGDNPTYTKIPKTGFLNSVLLILPTPDLSSVRALIKKYLFKRQTLKPIDMTLLRDINFAAEEERVKLFPSSEQAVIYFKDLVDWRPDESLNDFMGYAFAEQKMLGKVVAKVLANSVVPKLAKQDFSEENYNKLYEFYCEVDVPEVLTAFPYFSITNKDFIELVAKLLRRELLSDDANKVAYTSSAILTWRNHTELPVIDKLVLRMIFLIGGNLRSGQSTLLKTLHQMYNKKYLSEEHIETVVEVLPALFDASKYENLSPSSRESISISFVRAECIKFAKDIVAAKNYKEDDLNRIIEEAKSDPLPEVRFAIIDDF